MSDSTPVIDDSTPLENPLDILSQLDIIKNLINDDKLDEVNERYEVLHSRFPLVSTLWVIQLQDLLERDAFEIVEKLLAQCLAGDMFNNDLSLWMTYLDYVRRKNNLITGGQEARSIVIQAFDLVLEKCAQFDPESTPFWNDYLEFLEMWKPMNKWEEQQRIDMLRKLYKRMLVIPFNNLENMWNRYTKWEQEVNNLTARKFIGELSAEYMKARSLYQELSHIIKDIRRIKPIKLKTCNKNNIAQYTTTVDSDLQQLNFWIKWIDWEKENKLSLNAETLKQRINYVYQQSIQFMVFQPEMWYNYVMSVPTDNLSERIRILNIALGANPTSPTLLFKLAECFELENNIDEVKNCFNKSIEFMLTYHPFELKANIDEIIDPREISKIQLTKERLTFIYCIYMNTMKRLSGLSAARSVFSKCRKLKNQLTHQIYIENAYLESDKQNDDKTACKVLELGLKYFQNDGEYINKYLSFLISINKSSMIKTLFETSIDKIQDLYQLKSIYQKMINYETKFGNLNNVYSLEQRYFEKFDKEDMITTFTNRYQIQNENYIKKLELTYLYEEDQLKLLNFNNSNKRKFDQINDTGSNNLNNISLNNTHMSNTDTEHKNFGNSNNKKSKIAQDVPTEIIELLKVLPKRQYFKSSILDTDSLVDYLMDQVVVPTVTEEGDKNTNN